MGDIVSFAKFFVDGPFGNFQLVKVDTADFDDDRDVMIVPTVGVKGGAGAQFKEGGGEIKLSVYRETGTPELDYLDLLDRRVSFAFTRKLDQGQRHQFLGCYVSKVSEKNNSDGKLMWDVTLKYTKVKRLPI
jgi:hypothetical protein